MRLDLTNSKSSQSRLLEVRVCYVGSYYVYWCKWSLVRPHALNAWGFVWRGFSHFFEGVIMMWISWPYIQHPLILLVIWVGLGYRLFYFCWCSHCRSGKVVPDAVINSVWILCLILGCALIFQVAVSRSEYLMAFFTDKPWWLYLFSLMGRIYSMRGYLRCWGRWVMGWPLG